MQTSAFLNLHEKKLSSFLTPIDENQMNLKVLTFAWIAISLHYYKEFRGVFTKHLHNQQKISFTDMFKGP